jgi:glucose/arabinose dehydrogenase
MMPSRSRVAGRRTLPKRPGALPALLLAIAVAGCIVEPPGSPAASGPGLAGPSPSAGASPGTTEPSTPPAPLDLQDLAITLEPFVEVAGGPLSMAAPGDGSGRLLIAAQDGRIWLVVRGQALPEPMIDLGDRIQSGGEQGLLGIATHPSFPSDPRVFVHYTDQAGDSVVASLELDAGDDGRLDPGSHRQILFVDQPYANHNGGGVVFGPDRQLYVSLGDGGSGGDPHGNGQRRDTLLGKILRIDVDPSTDAAPYAVPADNPFAGGGGLPEIWQLGLRNPWRLSFDRGTGDLWIGDVGQGAWEEIDVARSGIGGLNFGWNVMEGNHCFEPSSGCRTDGLTPPVSEYGRELGCTVIGGYVYRGSAYPELVGAYLFADYCDGRIFAIDARTTELTPPTELGVASGRVVAFGEDADGELYVLSLDGQVSRIVAGAR